MCISDASLDYGYFGTPYVSSEMQSCGNMSTLAGRGVFTKLAPAVALVL